MRTCENESCRREFEPKKNQAEARFCCASCRREAYTLAQLRAGRASGGYGSLDAFLQRRRRRGNRGVVSV